MSYMKQQFSISDLENFSSIKAHTIRIWEKRYNLFTPERNVNSLARTYNLEDLKKILNISYLNSLGYKISKIAALKEEEIQKTIIEQLQKEKSKDVVFNRFKISMMEFDKNMFNSIYDNLRETNTFEQVYVEYFMPFLIEIGFLWQTNVINSTHEHFISYLIIQKIRQETIKVEKDYETEKLFVLFLPDNELHEIALLFCNYYLNLNERNTLYLGQTTISEDIFILKEKFNSIVFVSNITHQFGDEAINNFVDGFYDKCVKDTENELLISHYNFEDVTLHNGKIKKFKNVKNLLEFIRDSNIV